LNRSFNVIAVPGQLLCSVASHDELRMKNNATALLVTADDLPAYLAGSWRREIFLRKMAHSSALSY